MKTSIFLSSLLIASISFGADVKVPLTRSEGFVSGIITSENKFRISEIQEIGPRDLKITGELFKGQSTEQVFEECADIYSIAPLALKKEKKLVGFAMTLYPFTLAGLSKALQVEAETAPQLYKLTPVLRVGPKSLTRKVFPMASGEQLAEALFGKDKLNLESIARGESVSLDMSGYGSLVCDLVTGQAELSFKAMVKFPQTAPQSFVPITSEEIQSLSKKMIAAGGFNDSLSGNIVDVTSFIQEELNLRKASVDLSSQDPNALKWTRLTLRNLVNGIVDPATGKPQFMTLEKANVLAAQLKVVTYLYEHRELIWKGQAIGEKK